MRRTMIAAMAAALALAGFVYSQKARFQTVGRTEDGSFLLNTGWRIRPAGKNIPLSTLPMSQVLAPDRRMLAVLNGGYMPASLSLVDLETARESARVTITDAGVDWLFHRRAISFTRATVRAAQLRNSR